MNNQNNMENRLSELLTEGEMTAPQPETEAPKRLSPRYEVRIQAEVDPITTETKKYREIAQEIDGRYDKYVPRDSQ